MVTRFRAPFQFRGGLHYRLLKDRRGFLDSAASVQGDDIRPPPRTTRFVPLLIALAPVAPAPGLPARRRSSDGIPLLMLILRAFSSWRGVPSLCHSGAEMTAPDYGASAS